MNVEETLKVLSQTLTAAVALRSLARASNGLKKLLMPSAKKAKKGDVTESSIKAKQLEGALLGMGYKKPEVSSVVKSLSKDIEEQDLPSLVRLSLDVLNK